VDISSLPFLNTDLEINGTYPPLVEAFRQKILEADSVLFASPEYNYSFTGKIRMAILVVCFGILDSIFICFFGLRYTIHCKLKKDIS